MEARYSAAELGQVIRELRERCEPPMSQDELGRRANYGAGAGVSISRIEAGANKPSRQRFGDIARALGADPEHLEELARQRSGSQRDVRTDGPSRQVRRQGTPERLRAIQTTVTARTDSIETLASAFNEAHERARERFLLRFVAAGGEITQPPMRAPLDDEHAPSSAVSPPDEVITQRTQESYESGTGATSVARTAFRAGTMAAGGLSAVNARLLLIGIIVAPLSMLAAGGLLFLARRRSKREEEVLNSQLAESEAALDLTERGFDALVDVLPRATELLDYIGVHASHALDRWLQSVATYPVEEADLDHLQQQRYQDFTVIARCQLSVDSIDASSFMTFEGDALDRLIAEANETLLEAARTVHHLV